MAQRRRANVEGRIVSYVAGGSGSPTVVLEAGLGGTAAGWAPVVDALESAAHVVAYDRAGYGRSSDGLLPRSGIRLATELDCLLREIEAPAPYVLVGHSWGGIIVRHFAASHPTRVAGMVLVDPTVEGVPRLESAGSSRANAVVYPVAAGLARIGLIGALVRSGRPRAVAETLGRFSAEQRAAIADDYSRPRTFRAAAAEAASIAATLRAAGETAGPHRLPDVPFALLTAGRQPKGRRTAQMRTQIRTLQEGLAGAVRQGRLVVVEDAGHLIPQTHPEVVAGVVIEMLQAVRTSAASN